MLRFACYITGDDYQMLKTDTPASKKKVNTLVSILFLPVTMWFINVLLLVTGVMQGTITTGLVSALVAGLIIFMIERSIIMSNGSKTVMVFRIILGFLIAVLGSLAFDEVIFKQDIDQRMDINKKALLTDAINVIDSSNANKLLVLQTMVGNKNAIWQQSLDKASKEADGTSGSGMKGVSAIAKLKMSIAGQNELDYSKAQSDYFQFQKKFELEKNQATANIEKSFQKHALLARINAMFDLICDNGWMFFVYAVVTLVLFALEFIVVILKVSLPKSNYELKLEIIEEIGKKRLMRLMETDLTQFDVIRQYPEVRQSLATVKKISMKSIFN